MEQNLDEQRGIREYLLGILDDPARTQIEKRLLADDKFAEELEVAENELIEQYLAGELSAAESRHFTGHFLVAPQRKQDLRFIRYLHKYAAQEQAAPEAAPEKPRTPVWRQFFTMPAFSYALIFLAVMGLGFGVWLIAFDRPNDVQMAMAELPHAFKDDRRSDSRNAGSEYSPVIETRGTDPGKDPNKDLKKRALLLTLEKAVEDERTAESLYGLGEYYLFEGKFQDAIRYFEEASALGPVSARLMSDLGVAYLDAWREEGTGGKTEMLDKSLQSLDRAIELDPKLLEPRFNRALVLDAKGSREQAKQAWSEYLELDPNSQWSQEARRNLQRLEDK